MAATPTDTTAISGDVTPRRRGKSKAPNFTYDGPISVIRLELDVSDPVVRRRVERQWAAVFRLRRALQGDAAHRCRAYWAAHRERGADPKGLRDRLGLSRKGIESAAKAHIEASGWMRDHLTKAVGMHLADEVWETYRLVGNLAGHLVTYRHPQLPAAVSTAGEAASQPAGTSILSQPARLPAPGRPASRSWADHAGALAVVFTGLPAGDLVLPVRLPQGVGQSAHLCHFLADAGCEISHS